MVLGSLQLIGIHSSISWSESKRTTSPLSSRTVGPSIELTGATAAALPGCSTLIWVPAAMNSPNKSMLAGFIPAAASPVFLARP
ncbi:MAG: hypothetical protein A4E43_01196 [Methanosaeta sp. PtaB.Bin005]|nr:MAG: hypothetical protein A4E43_01196 [Methanosaeta sp. PtaB.Bin005]